MVMQVCEVQQRKSCFSEDLEFSQDKFCMPDPRQQDHRLNKDELVTYRYSVVLVEEQNFKFYLFTSDGYY